MDEHKDDQEFAFIKEKIKEKPINKRRVLMKIVWVLICAVIFGLTACLTFVIARPRLEKIFCPPEDPTITLLPDQEPEENEQEPEEPAARDPEPETVYVPEELELEDFQALQNKQYAVGKKANKSVVTVTAVTQNMDWFNTPYESKNPASGIIIGNNGQELLILTQKKVIADAEAINITFINSDVVPAALKKYDGNTGIAIVSVDLKNISEETLGKIEVAALGNSLTVNQGTAVIAIGNPQGVNYSILCGTITSSENKVSTLDSTYTIFTTDIVRSQQGSGVLINLAGEVVGVITQDISSEADQNTITALSVSDLKNVIQDLMNGRDIPYLGLKVSTVTDDIAKEKGIPKGVYIRQVELDSPAMATGLQESDVIVAVNGEEIQTVEQYSMKIYSMTPEQQITVTIQRLNADGYGELECPAVIGVLH